MIFEIQNNEMLANAVKLFCDFLKTQNVSSESIFDCKLVAYELLGNVLRHANGAAQLHGEIESGFVTIKIISKNVYYPKKENVCADVYEEHGRGLFLVDSVCKDSIFVEEDGLRVKIKITNV